MNSKNDTKFTPGTLLDRLNEHPPFFVFYMARRKNWRKMGVEIKHGRSTKPQRPTTPEMATAAGIPQRTFLRIASKLSWGEVKLKHINPFFLACGIDPHKTEKLKDYMRHAMRADVPFSHLTESQRKRFDIQCSRWALLKEQHRKATSA